MEPISMGAAGLMALGSALQGAGSYFSGREQAEATKKAAKLQAKESKRKTFADLLNEALTRSYDMSKDTRHSQNELAAARAKALQDTAAGIRQSLVK